MKKILIPVVMILSVFALLFTVVDNAGATKNTTTYDNARIQVNGKYLWRATNTFAGATDTLVFTLPQTWISEKDTMLYQVNIATISGNGDSVDLSVRYEVSDDNSNWYAYTLGTDSTSWVSTSTGTTYTEKVPVLISWKSYGGFYPYARLLIYGNTGNQDGTAGVYTKVRVDVKPFH